MPGISARLRKMTRPDAWDWLPSALLALHPSFAFWSGGGLETIPFMLLLLLLLRSHLDEMRTGTGMWSALWGSLALLMRPETPLLLLAFAFDRVWRSRGREKGRLLLWAVATFGVFFAFLFFRRIYFEDWLPNTFYAKTGGAVVERLVAGWHYNLEFFATLIPSLGMHFGGRE